MNDMITIPKAEYERLREAAEDLADLQAYERAKGASGQSIPADAVKRMIEGDSPLKVFRELRGLSQMGLARASGVNRVQVADIEAGRGKGSVDTLKKLADALSLTIDDLV